jgi:hypothetical protein
VNRRGEVCVIARSSLVHNDLKSHWPGINAEWYHMIFCLNNREAKKEEISQTLNEQGGSCSRRDGLAETVRRGAEGVGSTRTSWPTQSS